MPTVRLSAATVLIALAVAACGSSSSNSGSGSTPSSTPSSHASNATVKVGSVNGYGKALVSSSGKPLYILTADPKNGSKCSGSCASTWIPLTVSGKPTAGSGVNSSKLSEFKRSNGGEQVSYNGHALYTHTGPAGATADGTASDGGIWYLIKASGAPITRTAQGSY